MIDYEASRPAFESKYRTPCERHPDGEYIEPIHQTGWEHWCRGLEYAAQQLLPLGDHICAFHLNLTGECFICGSVDGPRRAAFEADEARHKAEQQSAPAPLPRPDKPGWWWVWEEDDEEWECRKIENLGWAWNGQWLPATPPPAPNIKSSDQ